MIDDFDHKDIMSVGPHIRKATNTSDAPDLVLYIALRRPNQGSDEDEKSPTPRQVASHFPAPLPERIETGLNAGWLNLAFVVGELCEWVNE
jgi:hypothetical protein